MQHSQTLCGSSHLQQAVDPTQEMWKKWGMDQHSYMKRLSFDEFFSKEQSELFIRDMFACPKVCPLPMLWMSQVESFAESHLIEGPS
jgi:hypothetical protein